MRRAPLRVKMPGYSIWLLEYAHAPAYPVGATLHGRHNEGTLVLPFCYGVLRGDEHVVLIDTGLDETAFGTEISATLGVRGWRDPRTILGRVGLAPEDVDTVVLTHNHFDHAGNVRAFPNATVHIQRREVSKYLEHRSLPDRMRWLTSAVDPDTMLDLVRCREEGRLQLVDGGMEILPGVELRGLPDTHTAGSQIVVVDNPHDGRWVFAGDNIYLWRNLEGAGDGRYIPIGLAFGSLEACMFAMDEMHALAGRDARRVIPFHDVELWEQFPSRRFDDGLHLAEISLRPGDRSRILD